MSLPLTYFLGISPASPEEHVLRELVELGLRYVGADEGSLLLVSEDEASLVFAMTIGSEHSEASLMGATLPIGEGLTGLAAQTGDVQFGVPVRTDIGGVSDARGWRIPSAVLAAPMHVRASLVGVITAVSFDPDKRFTPEHAELYARFANAAGLLVELRRRLSMIERSDHRHETQKSSPREQMEHEIIDAVAVLVSRHHERLPAILALLRAATDLAV